MLQAEAMSSIEDAETPSPRNPKPPKIIAQSPEPQNAKLQKSQTPKQWISCRFGVEVTNLKMRNNRSLITGGLDPYLYKGAFEGLGNPLKALGNLVSKAIAGAIPGRKYLTALQPFPY